MKSLIGELLIKSGIITEQQLEEALKQQKEKKKRLGEILIELGFITTKDLIWMLSEQADIPFVDVRPEMLDTKHINKFPEKLLYNYYILPLYETENKVFVALGDPTNSEAIQKIKEFTNKEVAVSGADPKKIEQLLNQIFLAQKIEEGVETEYEGKIVMKICDNQAVIEFIDSSGNVTRKRSQAEIIINIAPAKEKRK